jgi:hypothetical protein
MELENAIREACAKLAESLIEKQEYIAEGLVNKGNKFSFSCKCIVSSLPPGKPKKATVAGYQPPANGRGPYVWFEGSVSPIRSEFSSLDTQGRLEGM